MNNQPNALYEVEQIFFELSQNLLSYSSSGL